MKNITNEIAEKVLAHFESDEVKSLVETTEKAADAETGTFEVVITSENVDRYNEVVSQSGLSTEHYVKNPVVLWGHDHNILIGICTELQKREDGSTVALGKFAPTEEGQEKRKLYDAGFLKATSIGFIEKEREGNLITQSELLEFSFVSVPANPYALSLAMEKGLNINELVTKGIFEVKETETEKKGAVQENIDDAEAREKKWKNFSQVDDVIWSFWKAYFEEETPVAEFEKLLDETIEILKNVSAGEKNFALLGEIKEITEAPDTEARYTDIESIKSSALDAAEDGELEGTDDDDEDDDDNEDVKAFAKKQAIQKGVTALSEVLADIRSIDRK